MSTLATPVYNPKTFSRLVKKAQGADYLAEVGADNGKIYDPLYPGYVYVREPLSYDLTTGRVTGGETYLVRGHRNFVPAYGSRVRVTYDAFYDDWLIVESDPDSMIEQGIDPNIFNQLSPYNKFIETLQISTLRSFAVATGGTATTEVGIKNLMYLDYLGAQKLYRMPALTRPDLGDYEPAAGLKRVVQLWLNHDNTISASQSTPIDIAADFQVDTDLKEAIENRPNQLAIPVGAWKVENGLTTITEGNMVQVDTRPWLNTVQYAGFPNPVARNYIVPAGVSESVQDQLTVTADLTVEGDLTIVGPPPPQEWRDYKPSSVTLTTGTLNAGTLADAQVMGDGNVLVINEVTGVPGYDVRFNFTGVSTTQPPNFLVARWTYAGQASHFCTIALYNYVTTNWDQMELYSNLSPYYSSITRYIPIDSRRYYVDGSGNAVVRWYHHISGVPSQLLTVDYVGLVNSAQP